MVRIVILSCFTALIGILLYFSYLHAPSTLTAGKNNQHSTRSFLILLAIGFLFKCIGAAVYPGHETDMSCFNAWSAELFQNGFAAFYTADSFTDYPPGYMYILYVLGFLRSFLPLGDTGTTLLLKLPAIICDLGAAYLVWRLAKVYLPERSVLLITALSIFNPAVFVDSSLWGQVDSVFTLCIFLFVMLIANRRMIPAYFVFALSILMKPQAFMFAPLLLYGIIETVFLKRFDVRVFLKNLLFGIGAIGMMVLLSLPFGLSHVFEQYTQTLASYPFATVNAFNLWGALGMNWKDLTPVISILGYTFLGLIVIASAYLFFRSKKPSKYYLCAAFLCFATYMLSTKMHDRYMFSAMILLLAVYITEPNWRHFCLYAVSSGMQFFIYAFVLFIYQSDNSKYFQHPIIMVASIVNIGVFLFFLYNVGWSLKDHSIQTRSSYEAE